MKSIFGADHPVAPTAKAREVPGITGVWFFRDHNIDRYWRGTVTDEETGQEYDVRQAAFGWNVNDDLGRNHYGLTLRHAILKARAANG